ncbi:MAG: 16S rRNA (cytosine(1402)-N(4))-methyltransferase RsmH [Clostridiales bacterium]|nr:16S rRNA (cytosine(1402)-N(4))-methyltransferase RsmH [Clostridiales bacterium]
MTLSPSGFNHIPVLFAESVDSLEVKEDGVYVDCTAGGGSHSAAILERLKNGRLICIDRDPDAIDNLTARFSGDKRVSVVHDNFFNIKNILQGLGITSVDGVLADLGVSSYQLDTAQRGFSFHNEGPLDMRMSRQGVSAQDVVNNLDLAELSKIISAYGEEKFARQIANAIVKARQSKKIETTLELADIVRNAVPAKARRDSHPARRTFQAIRIYVNGELDGLENAVKDMFECLKIGGRVSVITFHSLEDKAVKQVFSSLSKGCTCPKNFPVCVCGNKPRAMVFKSVSPSDNETQKNPRARSARLRTAQRLL